MQRITQELLIVFQGEKKMFYIFRKRKKKRKERKIIQGQITAFILNKLES